MPSAARLEVRGKDKSKLRSWVRASGIRAGLAQRARIVLLAGEGLSNTEIATRVGVSRPTVIHWRDRYAEGGLAALADRKRSGRRRRVDEAQVVAATLNPPPERLGVTHWSSRLLGGELGIGFATVARIWRKWNLQPWRVETFKFSTDPELEAKVRDVVGLYLHPPENAVVLCIDEKSQVQALQRTAPILPIMPGVPEKATHDYIRNGTTTLFPPWRWPPARSSTPASPGTATRSSCVSSNRSPRPTRGGGCTSSATTTPPTSTPRSRPGWPATRGSRCTSPRRRDPG